MDAASCAGVPPPTLLSRSFADDAIARALHFSLCEYSPLVPEQPHHSVADDEVLGSCGAGATPREHAVVLPRAAPSSGRCRLGPAVVGRAGKRRPRPSKRAPTTYISTDAATFSLMVQQVTGAQIEQQDDACLGLFMPPPSFDFDGIEPALHLLTDPTACVNAYIPRPLHAAAAAAEQPCFPTLDSWNVMYGKEDEVV
ncbi:hypothetical protein ABZP36_005607 [Zizania latifolia]